MWVCGVSGTCDDRRGGARTPGKWSATSGTNTIASLATHQIIAQSVNRFLRHEDGVCARAHVQMHLTPDL